MDWGEGSRQRGVEKGEQAQRIGEREVGRGECVEA